MNVNTSLAYNYIEFRCLCNCILLWLYSVQTGRSGYMPAYIIHVHSHATSCKNHLISQRIEKFQTQNQWFSTQDISNLILEIPFCTNIFLLQLCFGCEYHNLNFPGIYSNLNWQIIVQNTIGRFIYSSLST